LGLGVSSIVCKDEERREENEESMVETEIARDRSQKLARKTSSRRNLDVKSNVDE